MRFVSYIDLVSWSTLLSFFRFYVDPYGRVCESVGILEGFRKRHYYVDKNLYVEAESALRRARIFRRFIALTESTVNKMVHKVDWSRRN